ncbi:hypothetical protein GQ42DRAFT_60845 [Ramicandelaber brevisporus]|nr:hypothetical protein GQ42DRAFT_60845 [Ramicandelaber brevisporus]
MKLMVVRLARHRPMYVAYGCTPWWIMWLLVVHQLHSHDNNNRTTEQQQPWMRYIINTCPASECTATAACSGCLRACLGAAGWWVACLLGLPAGEPAVLRRRRASAW